MERIRFDSAMLQQPRGSDHVKVSRDALHVLASVRNTSEFSVFFVVLTFIECPSRVQYSASQRLPRFDDGQLLFSLLEMASSTSM